MPYTTREVITGGKRKTQVVNKETGKVHAKGTTKEKAKAQIRLMNATEHGWKPTGKPARSSKGKK